MWFLPLGGNVFLCIPALLNVLSVLQGSSVLDPLIKFNSPTAREPELYFLTGTLVAAVTAGLARLPSLTVQSCDGQSCVTVISSESYRLYMRHWKRDRNRMQKPPELFPLYHIFASSAGLPSSVKGACSASVSGCVIHDFIRSDALIITFEARDSSSDNEACYLSSLRLQSGYRFSLPVRHGSCSIKKSSTFPTGFNLCKCRHNYI